MVTGALRPPVRSAAMVDAGRGGAERHDRSIIRTRTASRSYSLTPRKTPDGRDYRAVPAGADVSFDDAARVERRRNPPARTERKIKYYRNPMGLPDTSPMPKKDSMGMDYIAVYEGEDSDDGSVKLSPGRIQRTGREIRAGGARARSGPRSGRRGPFNSTSAASPSSRCGPKASS